MKFTIDIPDSKVTEIAEEHRRDNEDIQTDLDLYRQAVIATINTVMTDITEDIWYLVDKKGIDSALRRARRNNPPLTQAAILSEKD
jgi:hypothetical protein